MLNAKALPEASRGNRGTGLWLRGEQILAPAVLWSVTCWAVTRWATAAGTQRGPDPTARGQPLVAASLSCCGRGRARVPSPRREGTSCRRGQASVRPQQDTGLPAPAGARSSNLGSEMWLCVSECAVAHCLRGDLVSLLPWGPISGRKEATWAGGRGGSRLRDVPGTTCPIPGARLLPCAWALFCSLSLFLAILCHSSRAEAAGSPGLSLGSGAVLKHPHPWGRKRCGAGLTGP